MMEFRKVCCENYDVNETAVSYINTIDTFAWFVQSCRYGKSRTPDDEGNGRSKHVQVYINCRTNTYRKWILFRFFI